MKVQFWIKQLFRCVLLCILGVLLSRCVAVSPEVRIPSNRVSSPLFKDVTLKGLEFQGGLQQTFVVAVQDCLGAQKITRTAPVRLELKMVDVRNDTGAGRITWNVVNSALLLFLFGSPYLGSANATAEIRVYSGDEFLKAYQGKGRSDWVASGFAQVMFGRERSKSRAEHLAVVHAVETIAKDPPEIPPSN